MKCPTEIAIDDRREAELAKNGFMPMIHRKNSDSPLHRRAVAAKPAEYDDPDATANAKPGGRLPYLFACAVSRTTQVHRARQDRSRSGNAKTWRSTQQLDHELRGRTSSKV